MHITASMLALAGVLSSASATYTLVDNFTAENWMSSFSVDSITDPTGGFVTCMFWKLTTQFGTR